tara:strand:- start:3034 stop:4407 length:1374 start_codon:yes stop_codon:yes gene_type:complete
MPPILQNSLDSYYQDLGYENQEDYFEKIDDGNDIRFRSFEDFKRDFYKPEIEELDVNLGVQERPIREVEQEVQFVESPIQPADKKDLDFALFAKDSYNEVNKRKNINNHKYIEEDSNKLLATYYDDKNENLIMAIKGTSEFSDFRKDVGIALGSFGGSVALEPEYFGLTQKIKENEKKYNPKKITITGHSAGGSYSNYIGVDNPNYDVVTFNMGQGLPFVTDYVKCKMGGCENIKNYRIAGDFASSLSDYFSSGNVYNLKPIKPTESMRLEAESAESIFIPADLHIPHSIDQFIGRTLNNLNPDPYVYGRKLSSRVGAISAGITLPIISSIAGSKIGSLIEKETEEILTDELSLIPQEREEIVEFGRDLRLMGAEPPQLFTEILDDSLVKMSREEAEKQVLYNPTFSNILKVKNLASNFDKVSTFTGGLLGFGIGNVAGNLIYDNLLKPTEQQFANI